MRTFNDAASIAACPTVPVEPELQRLLAQRVEQWTATDVLSLTEVLIIEPEDTVRDISREIILSPLVNPLDGSRFGSKGFTPVWDWLHRHDCGFFEMIITVGDSGFAYVLFIRDADGVDPALLALCREYAGGRL